MELWPLIKDFIKAMWNLAVGSYYLFQEVRYQVGQWTTRPQRSLIGRGGKTGEVSALLKRLETFKADAPAQQERLCRAVVEKVFTDSASPAGRAAFKLLTEILELEGFLTAVRFEQGEPAKLSTSEMWEKESELRRAFGFFERPHVIEARLEKLLRAIVDDSDLRTGQARGSEEAMFSVPLYTLLPSPVMAVERVLDEIVTEPLPESPFYRLCWQLKQNMFAASGINPASGSAKEPVWPSKAKMEVEKLIDAYLGNTPFVAFLRTGVPFDVF
jgi:hypothetical protein